jgi:hypothetical protein
MNPISKLAIAGLIGAVAPLAAAGAAVAGPYGGAVYGGVSYQTPVARGYYPGSHSRHYGVASGYAHHRSAPAYAHRSWGARHHYPYHTYVSPYHYRSHATSWRPYPRHSAYGYSGYGYARPHYSVASGYSASVSPYFTGYSHAGTVSYPVYRVDHYKVDYASPMVTYSSENCGW